jgi:hypothetical protein
MAIGKESSINIRVTPKQCYGEHWRQARFDEHLRREDRDMPNRGKAYIDALKSSNEHKA